MITCEGIEKLYGTIATFCGDNPGSGWRVPQQKVIVDSALVRKRRVQHIG